MSNKYYFGGYASTIDDEGILWCASSGLNALFSVDLHTYKTEFHRGTDCYNIYDNDLFANAFNTGNKIIFTPMYGSHVCVYDKKEQSFRNKQISKNKEDFGYACKVHNDIYIPCLNGKIFRFSLDSYTVDVVENISRNVEEYKSKSLTAIHPYKHGFLMYRRDGTGILNIDLEDMSCKHINTNISIPLALAYFDNTRYWLANYNGDIYFLSEENESDVILCKNNKIKSVSDKGFYSDFMIINDTLILSNYYADKVACLKDSEVKPFFENPPHYKLLAKEGYGATYKGMHIYDEKVYFVPNRGNEIIVTDFDGNILEEIECCIEKDKISFSYDTMSRCMKEINILKECWFDLEDFLCII